MSGKKGGNKKNEQNQEDFKFNFAQDTKGNQAALDLIGKDANVLAHLQQRLGGLVGKSSGYLEGLPQSVQNRVKALKFLHSKRRTLEEEYENELLALEKKYDALFQPLLDRRGTIITGSEEPKPEELVEEEKKEETKEGEKKEEKKETKAEVKDDNVKGIPEFWIQTLKHHDEFAGFINERDEEALKHLVDLKVLSVADEPHSFTLEFHFSDNEFFEDKVLKKTYHLAKSPIDGEVVYDHVDCSEIRWKAGKNLTVKKVTKKQNKKKGGRKGNQKSQPATITVEEPCDSFFTFFNPEAAYELISGLSKEDAEEFDEEDEDYGLREFLEADYEMGVELKEKVIPHAVMFFTGEYDTGIDFIDGEDDEDGEEEDDEDDEDGEKDADFKPQEGQQQPECKQQ